MTQLPADPPAPRRARGPSTEKTAHTRASLLAAALDEFVEKGFDGAQMSHITARAGVAKGTAYRYFPTKVTLFEAVVSAFMAPLTASLCAVHLQPNESVRDFLRRSLLPLMETLETSRRADIARLALTEGRNFPFIAGAYRREAYDKTNDFIREAAQIALARGELSDDTLLRYPQLLVAPLWIAMIETGILAPGDAVSGADMLSRQIDLFFPVSGT